MKKVAVLMSAYNGYEYIEKQIESIYQQTYSKFELYIRDDGSDKLFLEQLRRLQKKYLFTLIEGENIGFVASFMTLLEEIEDSDLYAFADQDDIWFPEKLERAVSWFDEYDNCNTPMLYHSAYDVVDVHGDIVDYFYYSDDDYDFRRSITENHYSGFAMVINCRLREYMLSGDWNKIGYHDWWAAMIVQAFGVAHSDSKVMALHRAHGDNLTTYNWNTRMKWLYKSFNEESDIHKRTVEFEKCFKQKLELKELQVLKMFTAEKYDFFMAAKKCLYPKRWRPIFSSEIIIRLLMLLGRI